jgi:CBS domain-containing protein
LPDTPIAELAKLMRAHDVGCIPVGEDDKLVGMVTNRDIVCKGLARASGWLASSAWVTSTVPRRVMC